MADTDPVHSDVFHGSAPRESAAPCGKAPRERATITKIRELEAKIRELEAACQRHAEANRRLEDLTHRGDELAWQLAEICRALLNGHVHQDNRAYLRALAALLDVTKAPLADKWLVAGWILEDARRRLGM